jgi:hypothetical protein
MGIRTTCCPAPFQPYISSICAISNYIWVTVVGFAAVSIPSLTVGHFGWDKLTNDLRRAADLMGLGIYGLLRVTWLLLITTNANN